MNRLVDNMRKNYDDDCHLLYICSGGEVRGAGVGLVYLVLMVEVHPSAPRI